MRFVNGSEKKSAETCDTTLACANVNVIRTTYSSKFEPYLHQQSKHRQTEIIYNFKQMLYVFCELVCQFQFFWHILF